MSDLSAFYDLNPVGVIDQDRWDLKSPAVNAQFRAQAIYTPMMDWDASSQETGAVNTTEFELLEGDVDSNPIPMTANYIDAQGIDSRSRSFSILRFGDKVQLHKSSNYFTQWRKGGTRDWRPLLRGLLGWNVVTKFETLARNVWFKGSKSYWTYAGSGNEDIGDLEAGDRFTLEKCDEWNLRLGYTGSPVIPGDMAAAKVAIIPPGAQYDFMRSLAAASASEASMWRDATLYQSKLNYELGTYKGIRFVVAPSNKYGVNPNVLYNAGIITQQHAVTRPITMGDGSPDPETTLVDGIWAIGQKDVTHYLQLDAVTGLALNDYVTIHIKRTDDLGVSGGVDPFDGKTIVRRIVGLPGSNRIQLDRPVMFNFMAPIADADGSNVYAYVTKGLNVGFGLVLGSRGGVKGLVHKPLEFYEPKPVDDFDSVWRFSWDSIVGHNIAEPNMFELTFFSTSIPKPGGVA